MNDLTIGSLFTGCGGLDLGLHAAGHRTIWACENDPACRRVISRRFPDLPILPDVRDLDAGLPRVDVLAGGFPCQDLSYAGRGAGLDGDRSGLWHSYARAIRLLRPRLVIVENVPGLATRGLGRVLYDLAEARYVGSWIRLRAADIGAPHVRDRLFILARDAADTERLRIDADRGVHGGGPGQPLRPPSASLPPRQEVARSTDSLPDRPGAPPDTGSVARPETGERDSRPRAGSEPTERGDQREAQHRAPGCASAPPDTDAIRRRRREDDEGISETGGVGTPRTSQELEWGIYEPAIRRWERELGRPAPRPTNDRGRLEPTFVEWMLGFPHDWTAGEPRSHRLRMLGNAVQVQVAETIGRRLEAL